VENAGSAGWDVALVTGVELCAASDSATALAPRQGGDRLDAGTWP